MQNLFQQNFQHLLDDWDQTSYEEKELEYHDDPLAFVCAGYRRGSNNPAIYESFLLAASSDVKFFDDDGGILAKDREHAAKIRQHFKNKILLRRLKKKPNSSFMADVEDMLGKEVVSNKLKLKHLKALVKLPCFYQEDKDTEAILNSYKSYVARQKIDINCQLEYAGTVERRSSATKSDFQYWRTPDNHLVQVELPLHDVGRSAWEFFVKQQTVNIRIKEKMVQKVKGHDFLVLSLGLDYEIKPS